MSLPRILIIDDEPGLTRLVFLVLEHRLKKYEVKQVNDSLLALEAARQFKPHLILVDTLMPQLDGFGLVDQFKADSEFKGVPIVIMENSGKREASFSTRRMHGCPYLSKPFTQEGLLACIEHYLSHPGS